MLGVASLKRINGLIDIIMSDTTDSKSKVNILNDHAVMLSLHQGKYLASSHIWALAGRNNWALGSHHYFYAVRCYAACHAINHVATTLILLFAESLSERLE